ncbi:MAG: selenocysteine-specific translation elongation factor [Planctomycetota bacterium]|nr:selenocysteine-specific translation elongation factor [Planctomycetota bacterium]
MAERKFKPEFAQALVGTAGHVDHGKTSLVRLLTGCDTDRLPEEKARGLSIDLGFAPCLLPGKRIVGIVDVPGHSDFIRNMVAGAASIDVLMLVTAADDGIMPQTDEHMKIVKLLRTPQVMVALTKTDLVPPERLAQVRQDLAAFLARMGFPDAPIVGVSNRTGEGVEEIRQALNALVERASQRPPDRRVFRMNVERTFSVKGLGTVVTGIPLSGAVRAGDKAELLPAGLPTGVRTIQTFKFDTDVAQAHVCAAIALRDVEPEKAARGMTLAAPGVFKPVTSVIATLQNASDSFCFKHNTDVKLHTGTAAVLASLRLIGTEELRPGHEGFAQVKLDEPLVLAAGDQYIVRSLSPIATAGGGTVLCARTVELRHQKSQYPERLQKAAAAVRQGDLLGSELLAGPHAVLPAAEILRLTQLPEALAAEAVAGKEKSGELLNLGGGAWLVPARRAELAQTVQPVVAHYHQHNKYAWGLAPIHVCNLLELDVQSFPKLAEALCADGTLAVKHGRLALPDFQPAISAGQVKMREELLARITAAGINAPARGDLVTALKMTEPEMKLMIQLLVEDGSIKVLDKNLLSYEVYARCRQKIVELFAQSPVVDITTFRSSVGASRNLAFAMMDAFAGEGLTKRVEKGHVLVKKQA